uniref:Cadherin domain-containing protein n=1 Tax=Catharus ustulatus TaxID=91951 RepID=A0A8C3TZK8_CATUS
MKSKDENKIAVLLVLTKALDRETIPVHRLVLTATDGGRPSLTGTMELVISVVDANDNAPQFNQSVYKVQLPENTVPGTVFFQLTATDKDEGINREIYYAFSDGISAKIQDLFKIDEKLGEIRTVGELDFEDIQSYDLEIEARDKGTPPLSGHCSLVLEVVDVNDNAPEVWVTSLSVPVPEDASVGTVVALLSVSDRDSGANGRVRCWHFSVDLQKSNDGNIELELVLTKSLDRETIPVHRLVLTATDGGRPSLTGTMELVISVVDANDNAPQFNQSVYKVALPENATEGTLVTRVNATDADEGINSEVTYAVTNIIPPSGRDVISINAKTGEIRLTGALDFEEVSVFNFRIEARDQGTPSLSGHCKVVLEVLDVNDNTPEVSGSLLKPLLFHFPCK